MDLIIIKGVYLLVQLRILSPQNAAVSYKCCQIASCLQRRIRSTILQLARLSSIDSSLSVSKNTSAVVSLAKGCVSPVISFPLLGRLGEKKRGDPVKIERFGSSAKSFGSIWKECTSCEGSSEKEELIDPRVLEPEGEGRFGIEGIENVGLGGVAIIKSHNSP